MFSFLDSSMSLEACIFIMNLKREVCKSKIYLENGLETHELDYQFAGGYNNVV
jgi:hypothetical protein